MIKKFLIIVAFIYLPLTLVAQSNDFNKVV